MSRALPRTVVLLGVVSLFTDLASEMIYPLMPAFLVGVLGAGAVSLGVVEGVAESTAALLKLASGVWSDRARRRKPLIVVGYGLASAVRPVIGFATSWIHVLAIRFADRIGKGLRSSPRDALIADVTPAEQRGAAFGLHRAMDHAGAVLGPLVAAALLAGAGMSMRDVFLIAAVPGAIVIGIVVFGVREPPRHDAAAKPPPTLRAGRELGREFRWLLAAVFLFTLGNSTDAFLLLRLGDAGVDPAWIALLWSAHHVLKMLATYAGGRLSDHLGRRSLMIAGWLLYAAVYLGFAWLDTPTALVAMFLAYGIYFGLTEPVERAWIADLAPPHLRGTAFGYYHLVIGAGALPASLLFGLLWRTLGAPAAFATGSALAFAALLLLLLLRRSGPRDAA